MSENLALPADRRATLHIVPGKSDTNMAGDIFSSRIMSQADLGPVVTVAVNSFVSKSPVPLGDVVSFYAQVEHTGRTYVTVDIEVFAQHGFSVNECIKVTEARFT